MQKELRTNDKAYLEAIRKLPCIGCGANPPSEAHHIKTRGSGGGDDHWNILSLCVSCHKEWHDLGRWTFCETHPWVHEYLKNLGWIIDNEVFVFRE